MLLHHNTFDAWHLELPDSTPFDGRTQLTNQKAYGRCERDTTTANCGRLALSSLAPHQSEQLFNALLKEQRTMPLSYLAYLG